MNVTACPDGSLVVVPVTVEQFSAIGQALGIAGPDDDPLSFDGRFVLTVPASRAAATKRILPKLDEIMAEQARLREEAAKEAAGDASNA